MSDYIINALATLIVTLDPIGLAPMFLALTAGATALERRRIAVRATITAAVILFLFYLAGQSILNSLGISVTAFRVAGGILLFVIAFEMVFDKRQKRKVQTAEHAAEHVTDQDDADHRADMQDLAVFPLAIPLIAGPATISAVILLSGQAHDGVAYGALAIVLVIALGLCLLSFLAAHQLERLLGDTIQVVITRLLGVLLAAMSVQFVADGVLEFARHL